MRKLRSLTHGSWKMVFGKMGGDAGGLWEQSPVYRWQATRKQDPTLQLQGTEFCSWPERSQKQVFFQGPQKGRQATPHRFLLNETLSRGSSWAHQASDLQDCEFIFGCCWKFPHLCLLVAREDTSRYSPLLGLARWPRGRRICLPI